MIKAAGIIYRTKHCGKAAGHLQVGLIGEVYFEQNFDGRVGLFQVGQGERVLGWGTSSNGRQADRPGWDQGWRLAWAWAGIQIHIFHLPRKAPGHGNGHLQEFDVQLISALDF